MKTIILILFFLIVNTVQIFSDTMILDKEIYGNWTKKDSPYLIQGEVIIPKDKTLTIEPGVTIKLKTSYNDDYSSPKFDIGFLRINGRLIAEGTIIEPIIFTRYKDTKYGSDNWGTILFNTDYEDSIIEYCRIEYSNRVVNVLSEINGFWGAISFYKSKAIIKNNIFINNTYAAISCINSSPNIINNFIINRNHKAFAGIHCKNLSYPKIINNTIVCQNGRAIVCYNSVPVVLNSIIFVNGNSGSRVFPQYRPNILFSLIKTNKTREIYRDMGNNIIEEDPQFVNINNNNFKLKEKSPCLRAGYKNMDIGANLEKKVSVSDVLEYANKYIYLNKDIPYENILVSPYRALFIDKKGDEHLLINVTGVLYSSKVCSLMLSKEYDLSKVYSFDEIKSIKVISKNLLRFSLTDNRIIEWELTGLSFEGYDPEIKEFLTLSVDELKEIIFQETFYN